MLKYNSKGQKLYPVGLFNRLNDKFDMFCVRVSAGLLPETDENLDKIEAINNAYEFDGMYYAEYKYWRILKNFI